MLVLLVALLLFGSKNLPKVARTLGKTMEEFRRAARHVSNEILRAGDAPSAPPRLNTPPKSPAQTPPNKDASNDGTG